MPASAELRERFVAEGCEAGLADDALGAEFAALRAASCASWAEIEHRLFIFWWGLAVLIIGWTVVIIAAVAVFWGGA